MVAYTADLPNLDAVKTELIRYHDSGTYLHQQMQLDNAAKNYLLQRVAQNNRLSHPKKLAIVLDIDETALSNYQNMFELHFGGRHQDFLNQLCLAQDPVIQPTLDLFNTAEKNHVAVFFITGRPESTRSPTIKNLDGAGYFKYNGIYFKPNNYHALSVIPYKSAVRKQIEANGYDIILSVGDQASDLQGGFVDKGFKLPNPYYYIA